MNEITDFDNLNNKFFLDEEYFYDDVDSIKLTPLDERIDGQIYYVKRDTTRNLNPSFYIFNGGINDENLTYLKVNILKWDSINSAPKVVCVEEKGIFIELVLPKTENDGDYEMPEVDYEEELLSTSYTEEVDLSLDDELLELGSNFITDVQPICEPIVGPQGPRGEMGPQGPRGFKGEDGHCGAKGEKGATGPRGEMGPQGPQGPKGEDGHCGAKGEKGATGPRGEMGPQGPQGNAATININKVTVTKGATPTIKNIGDKHQALLNITLPDKNTISVAQTRNIPYYEKSNVVNIGTPYDAIFRFSLRQGAPGMKGDKGDPFSIKGFVKTVIDLPSTDLTIGDVYGVGIIPPYDIYIYTNEGFVNIGPFNDIKSGVFDGGCAGSKYGGARVIDCGKSI